MRKTEYELPAGVSRTIALVTDLHEFDPEPVLEILRQVRPDVIAVAGDTLERYDLGDNLDEYDPSLSSRWICAGFHAAKLLGSSCVRKKKRVIGKTPTDSSGKRAGLRLCF